MLKIYVVIEKHWYDDLSGRIVNDMPVKSFVSKQEAIDFIEDYVKDKDYRKEFAEVTGLYRWTDIEHKGIIKEWSCKEIALDC